MPLIEEYTKLKLHLQIKGFIENIYLLIYGESIETNYYILKKVYEVYLKLARIYSLTFAFKKYELVYFIRTPKRFNIKAVVDLRSTITESKYNIRVLGLYVDSKVEQSLYIKKIKVKIAIQSLALLIITTSIQSITFNYINIVYNIVVKLVIIYVAST